MSVEGEVEIKVRELGDEIFAKYNGDNKLINSENQPYIKKEHLKEFIKDIMRECGELDAWSDEAFEEGYKQFDKDGSGEIDRSEFDAFVKRFADL